MPQSRKRPAETGEVVYREARIDLRAVDEESRTVELAFASEERVERWWGVEILDHSPGSARLERLNNGASLLMDHNTRDQIGVIESARIDKDRKARARVRFGRGARASEILADVLDGIRSLISVGYRIHEEVITSGMGNAPDEIRVTDWEPLEISFVAIPADATVGVGRSGEITGTTDGGHDMPDTIPAGQRTQDPADVSDADLDRGGDDLDLDTGDGDDGEERSPARLRLDNRLRALGKRFRMSEAVVDEAIELEDSLADFQTRIRAHRSTIHKPVLQPVDDPPGMRIEGGAPRYSARSLDIFGVRRGVSLAVAERTGFACGMWARATLFGDPRAQRWCAENGVREGSRALAEGIFAAGGALVPEVMIQALIDNREMYGIARQLLSFIPMSSDTATIPRRTGKGTAAWKGEAQALTESQAAFDQVELVAKKLTGLSLLSTELAEDAVIDLGAFVTDDFAQVFAESEDDAWINGDGTSAHGGIVGMRVKLIDGNHTVGAVDAASAHDTYAEIDQDDLNSVMAVLPVYALPRARWLASQPGKALVFDALAAASGGTTMMMLGDRPQMSYLGYPISLSQKMPTSVGDLSDVAMFLIGDFGRACVAGDRRGFSVQVLRELYAATDQIGVKITERVDIVVHDLGSTTEAGPVVGLIGE